MSRAGTRALCMLLLLAGLGLWGWGKTLSKSVLHGDGVYRLLYEPGAGLTGTARGELEEYEEGRYAFARQEQAAAVKAPALEQSRILTWLEVYGDISLVLEGLGLQEGQYPSDGQCLVDGETAWTLWGSEEAVGHRLELDGREYRVAGVIRGDHPLLVTSFGGGEDFSFTHIYYAARKDTVLPLRSRDEFLARAGLGQPAVCVGLHSRDAWMGQICQLPLWLLGIAWAEHCLRGLLPGGGRRRWGRWLLRLCVLLLMGTALGFSIPFTAEQLPARWSNFSFWSARVREGSARAASRWTAPGLLPAYLSGRQSLFALLLSAMSCVCLSAALLRMTALGGKTRAAVPGCPDEQPDTD